MKFWFRYLKEKRYTILLILVTSITMITVGWLSHADHLDSLFYGALLALSLWCAAGIWDGMIYVRRSRRLEEALDHFDQYFDLLSSGPSTVEKEMDLVEWFREETLAADFAKLLELTCDRFAGERSSWEEKNADRNDYYVMWTHQIKTPIAAMRLLLESEEQGSRDFYLMRGELFKIEQYAEMALAYQRLESLSSDLVLQEHDLYTLLKQTVKKYSLLFINKSLSLEMDQPQITIVTDEKWFGFCIEQFLSNSIKYTSQGKISIRTETRGEDTVLLIEDTGIGIRPEDLPRIFERGFTGYNGRLDKRSTGIGLYLCRRVLDHLGISAKVDSKVNEGTKVTLTLVCKEKQ